MGRRKNTSDACEFGRQQPHRSVRQRKRRREEVDDARDKSDCLFTVRLRPARKTMIGVRRTVLRRSLRRSRGMVENRRGLARGAPQIRIRVNSSPGAARPSEPARNAPMRVPIYRLRQSITADPRLSAIQRPALAAQSCVRAIVDFSTRLPSRIHGGRDSVPRAVSIAQVRASVARNRARRARRHLTQVSSVTATWVRRLARFGLRQQSWRRTRRVRTSSISLIEALVVRPQLKTRRRSRTRSARSHTAHDTRHSDAARAVACSIC